MARMTIAQLREREVIRLATYKNQEPTENDINEARAIMNSFYRLCGLCETLLYWENDERTYNKYYTREAEAKRDRWDDRLKSKLKPYGLTLYYSGYCPSIGTKDAHGGCSEKITRWFYQ